ncbi:MAG TPA: serine/threonine-protein kinase, partial [Polyangium sp.]|nr:serine/threonine-protein kinase [Polyangium sp.]
MDSGTSPSSLTASGYERIARAGLGGAAEVWKAKTTDGRFVALKIAHHEGAHEALAREAMHALLAISPRLPALIDAGFLDGDTNVPFLALQWIEGTNLRDWLRKERSDRHQAALQITHDVAEALADLHSVGLAHGDLKPENIVVDEHHRAALIDLGLSGSAYETTLEGATPRYLATGDNDLGDARARDLLALGIVVAELIDADVAAASTPLVNARSANLPAPFDTICTALLTRNPSARPTARWVVETARAALAT